MSDPSTITDAQLQHLLDIVVRRRDESCTQIREKARIHAREIVRQAHQSARAHAREDLAGLREQMRRQRAYADAQRQTQLRQQRQQHEQALLTTCIGQLPAALQQLWDDTPTRKRWVETLVNTAADTLLDAHWTVEHPVDWPGQECLDLKQRLSETYECFPSFEAQSSITAGLRIHAGGACIDGSSSGLLQARTRIASMLLAQLRRHTAAAQGPAGEV